jgi:hypothetical protein
LGVYPNPELPSNSSEDNNNLSSQRLYYGFRARARPGRSPDPPAAEFAGRVQEVSQIHRLIYVLIMISGCFEVFLITSKVLDARRRGATTEAYEQYSAKEERSKATPQMMP